MFPRARIRPIEILLVEDNPGDVRLTIEALHDGKIENRLSVVNDGVAALTYLRREGDYRDAEPPDLVLLDLNLPRKDGRELLSDLSADDRLRKIPVVVLTTSNEEHDVLRALELDVAGYMTKPVDFAQLLDLVRQIGSLRLAIVTPVLA
jgi:CheY-like chemotaxis protein